MSRHVDRCHHHPWIHGKRHRGWTAWRAGCECGWSRPCSGWKHARALALGHSQEIR